MQRYATVGLDASSKARRVRDSRRLQVLGPEIVAPVAVPHVELVADDRKEHGMRAVQKLPIFDGVEAEIGGKFRRSSPVPARAVKVLRLGHERGRVVGYLVCSGT